MNFKFEFLNIHVNHLTQLRMINVTLKCQEKNICKKIQNFHHYSTCFLTPRCVFVVSQDLHLDHSTHNNISINNEVQGKTSKEQKTHKS
jgi:hypothetical protein